MIRSFLSVAVVVAGLLPLAAIHAAEKAKTGQRPNAERPNIVYILADDLGYGDLGCYGSPWIKTPNLDRMAAEGMRFTQHYSGSPVCASARCTLMTGKHTGRSYIRNNGNPPGSQLDRGRSIFPGQNPLPAEEVTIAEMLKQRGYATGAMGKWGLGPVGTSGDPNKQGFDLFYGYNCQVHAHNHYPRFLWRNSEKEWFPGNDRQLSGEVYSQDKFTEVAVEFIRENRGRPFFLYLPLAIPHLALQVPDEALKPFAHLPRLEYEHTHPTYVEHPHPRAAYAAMIHYIDRDIGTILKLIRELGLDEKTLVIFTSDNGPSTGGSAGTDSEFFKSAGPLRGGKGQLYEGGVRVPMIARWPGTIRPGTVSDHPCAFWDMLPTLADLVGAEPPAEINGLSFAPTLLGRSEEQQRPEYLYWEYPARGGSQAIRVGDWKAIRPNLARRPANRDPLKIELYNLADDVGETTDVAAEHPELVETLAKKMREARVPSELFPIPALDRR